MATAPPSDQPPAMIREAGKTPDSKFLIRGFGRFAAADLGGLAAALAVAQEIGDENVQAEAAESIEFLPGIGQAHRVAVEVDQGRPRAGIGMGPAVGQERRAVESDHALAVRGGEGEQLRARRGMSPGIAVFPGWRRRGR